MFFIQVHLESHLLVEHLQQVQEDLSRSSQINWHINEQLPWLPLDPIWRGNVNFDLIICCKLKISKINTFSQPTKLPKPTQATMFLAKILAGIENSGTSDYKICSQKLCKSTYKTLKWTKYTKKWLAWTQM